MLSRLMCVFFNHPSFSVVCGPTQMLKLRTYQVDGGEFEREVPGFHRVRTCKRCKVIQHEIVFTPREVSE